MVYEYRMRPGRVQFVQNRSFERRQAIVDAAKVVIKREGRDRFTTQQVATEAGCSIGTIYAYFADRVDILDEVWPDRPQDVPW